MNDQSKTVKIQLLKTHKNAKLPTKTHDDDNCWDVYAVEKTVIPPIQLYTTQNKRMKITQKGVRIGHAIVPVGLKVGYISPGYGIVIRGRSGLGFKHGIVPHFGEIDNGYRGDLGIKLYNFTNKEYIVKKGDRIAQLKIEKVYNAEFEFTDTQSESHRAEKGFGSSGK